MRSAHQHPHNEWLALVVCVGLAVLLLSLPDRTQFAVADGLGGVLTEPWLRARNFAEDLLTVRRENERLLARLTEMQLREATRQRAAVDSARGAAAVALDPGFRGRLAPCSVLARRLGRTATMIAVRSDEPLAWRPLQPVVSADGLVGRIRSVQGPHEAWVELLTAPEFAVGCEVEGKGLLGVFRRRGGRFVLDMVGRDEDSVRPGDLVVTSGIAEVPEGSEDPAADEQTWARMPRGLPVARVVSSKRSQDMLFRDIEVEPLASFTRNQTVFLVLGERPWPARPVATAPGAGGSGTTAGGGPPAAAPAREGRAP